MIIGIDASRAARSKPTGIENTAYQFILNLLKLDQKNYYFLYTDKKLPKELTRKYRVLERLIYSPKFWNKTRLPLAMIGDQPEVFIQPSYMIPLFAPKKSIGFVHDLAWAKFPGAYSSFDRFLQRWALNNIVKKSEKIICVSESTKKDLLALHPNTAKKIKVISLGYNTELFHEIENPRDILKLDSPYILCVGRLEERKNTLNLVKAFVSLKESKKIPHKLVLVGREGYNYHLIVKEIRDKPDMKSEIIMPGYIDGNNLPDLYANAAVFAFPSLYEGFGLPVLEAMACGAPVVTSDTSSLPEVAGNAALTVNPNNVKQISSALYETISDRHLSDTMTKRGLEQVKKFSWEKSAKELLGVIEELK